MKFNAVAAGLVSAASLVGSAFADSYEYERLEKDNAVLVILDMQEGLFQMSRDWDATLYKQNMFAHAAIGTVFKDLPVILTSSADSGPNGKLPQEILEMYPTAPLIQRQGEVNAWDNSDFRAAIKATNRTQIIIGGIVTDVCTAFLARSLRAEGYSVWANLEASGTTTPEVRDISNWQMLKAGVNVVSLFSIICDLMRDWRHVPGAEELYPFLDKYFPGYGMLARAHKNAKLNGTIVPGQDLIPM